QCGNLGQAGSCAGMSPLTPQTSALTSDIGRTQIWGGAIAPSCRLCGGKILRRKCEGGVKEKMGSAESPCSFERRTGVMKVCAMSELPPLRDFPLFASLDEATLHRLTLDAKVETYADGDVIFRQGDAVAAIMLIVRGFVKLLRTAPCGDETLVSIRSDGASVND